MEELNQRALTEDTSPEYLKQLSESFYKTHVVVSKLEPASTIDLYREHN